MVKRSAVVTELQSASHLTRRHRSESLSSLVTQSRTPTGQLLAQGATRRKEVLFRSLASLQLSRLRKLEKSRTTASRLRNRKQYVFTRSLRRCFCPPNQTRQDRPPHGTVKFSGRVADLVDETRHAKLPRIPFSPRDHQPHRLAVSPCAAASCREDDGRPVEVGGQEPASNHPKRLSLRVAVVSVGETSSMTRQVWIRKTNASEPPLTRREPVHDIETDGG